MADLRTLFHSLFADKLSRITQNSYLTLTLIFMLLGIPCFSQPVLQWDSYVSFNEVNCMLDLEDSVWVGTDGGLASIDKATLSVRYYNKFNSGLKDCRVNALVKIKTDILLGTDCGLVSYQNGTWTTYTTLNSTLTSNRVTAFHYEEPPLNTTWVGLGDGNVFSIFLTNWTYLLGTSIQKPGSRITCLARDSVGIIWAGTDSNAVYKFDSTDWINYDPLASFIVGHFGITDLIVDNNGTLFAGMVYELFRNSSNGNWVWVNNFPYWGYNISPTKFSVDNNNKLWFSNRWWGMRSWDGSVIDTLPLLNPNLTSLNLTWLLMDSQHLWIGSQQNGVDEVTGNNVVNVPLSNGLPANTIIDIDFDSAGTAWMALHSKSYAFSSFDGNNFTNYSTLNTPLTTNLVRCLTIDSNDTHWYGTDLKGLFVHSTAGWTKYDILTSNITSDKITAIATDYNNNILLGFLDGEVQIFHSNSFTTVTNYVANSNVNFHFKKIYKIVPENANRFWIATDSVGLIMCDYVNIVVYDTSNSALPSNRVEDVKIDSDHHIWAATGKGLAEYSNGSWTVYDTANSPLPENHITALTFGKDSSLWVGTFKSGLVRIKSNGWTVYDKCIYPLVSNNIFSLKTDDEGRIFVGTKDGLNIITLDNISGEAIFQEEAKVNVYPNPGSTSIHFNISLPHTSKATLKIFNPLGQQILQKDLLPNSIQNLSYDWDITNHSILPGIYYYTLQGDFGSLSGKVVVIR